MVLLKTFNLQFWGLLCLLCITATSGAGQNRNLQADFFEPNAKLKRGF